MPGAARPGGDGAGHPAPLWSGKRAEAHRMVVRHKQSVIVGCKPVLPKLPSVET